jgi:hypothetical protein
MVLRDAAKTCAGRTVRLNRIDRYWCTGPDACDYGNDVSGDLGTAILHAGTAYMDTAIFTLAQRAQAYTVSWMRK